MDLQVVCVLATLFTLAAGSCDVYNISQSKVIERCAQVQDCVNKALLNDRNNLYILDQVFRSTKSRPPIALIVNYHVTIANGSNITSDYDGASCGSGDNADIVDSSGEVIYTEQLGWSTTGIYNIIRAEFLVSLQPELYWWTLSFAIENHGLPKPIHLYLNIANTTECDLLENITKVEVKEALEHLTENLNYETSGKVWNTQTNSLQKYEKCLLIIMASLCIFTAILLLAILPSMNSQNSGLLWNGFNYLFIYYIIIPLTDHILNRPIIAGLPSNIFSSLDTILLASYLLGYFYGIINSCSFTRLFIRGHAFGLTSWLAISLAIYSIPVGIEAFIYPTEIISTLGFIVIGVAGNSAAYTTITWFIRNGTCIRRRARKKKKNQRVKHGVQMLIIGLLSYIVVPIVVHGFLLFYLSLLRQRLESPTSQLIQTLLAFLPPILAGFGSFFLKKKLGSKVKSEATKKKDNEPDSDDDVNTSNDQTPLIHSDSANEDQQSDNEQPRQTMTHEPHESESQEILVTECTTNTLDGEHESNV